MTGHVVELNFPPKRIVSLVPSQTELLYDLGLADEVVGITKFCVHPQRWFREKTRIGGTKTVNLERVAALKPDLIIANKEENTREQVESLAQHYPVWTSNIQTITEGLQMIRQVGGLVGKEAAAIHLADEISAGFAGLQKAAVPKKVAYFIWRGPWMCAGGDTFISDMITAAGWQNVLAGKLRYPTIELQELALLQPDLILLSSEPYPFKEQHIAEIKAVIPYAEIKLVDGELFSWYGSRMLNAIPYLSGLIG
jgi:ABC-type Fe3+-hydroxamate transport system substrate-binding protein